MTQFPQTRLRRLRQNASIRQMVREHSLKPADFIQPFFILEGKQEKQAIASMPDIYRQTIDYLIEDVRECYDLGMRAVALFPVTPLSLKTDDATEALNPDNLMCRAISALKQTVPEMMLITDVALDPYTLHGHDGILDDKGYMLNDATITILVQQALNQARAGADIIAPSDMTDGRIGKIRDALEEKEFPNTLIMSYSAKYASSFYGPFRDAVGSEGNLIGDKKTYQMDFAGSKEALREIEMDIQEGADMVIIKPAMPYLDIVKSASERFSIPIYVYQVSGEYAMVCAASQCGFLNRSAVIYESLMAFKRAGATGIITYFAKEFLNMNNL